MPKKQTFESSLSELHSIIEQLESESLSLDQMISLFEDGNKLMKICRQQLNKVEDRITTLIKENDEYIEKSGIDKS